MPSKQEQVAFKRPKANDFDEDMPPPAFTDPDLKVRTIITHNSLILK